jgi:hypothetical protein
MKAIYFFFFFAFAPLFSFGQCSVITTGLNTTCYGSTNGTAAATANGASPFSYLWSPGNQTTSVVNGLGAGTYTVTMTDNVGCVAVGTVTITSPAPLTQTMTTVAPSCGNCCNGSASVVCSGGSPPYSYQWMPSGGSSSTATGLCAGTYTCCMTDANGCSTCNSGNCPVCQTSVNLSPTGQNEVSENYQLDVFPSPATDFVNVKETFPNPVSSIISITNVLGETVYSKTISQNPEINENINVSNFDSGVYFISVKTSSGTSVRRFVKQ